MTRTKRKAVPQPKEGMSAGEKAVAARFVRASRERSYWMPIFVEALLHVDAASGLERVGVNDAQKILKALERFEDGSKTLNQCLSELRKGILSGFSPISNLRHHDNSGLLPEDEFMELVRLWRLEYPEPAKKHYAPQGHLGREESGD